MAKTTAGRMQHWITVEPRCEAFAKPSGACKQINHWNHSPRYLAAPGSGNPCLDGWFFFPEEAAADLSVRRTYSVTVPDNKRCSQFFSLSDIFGFTCRVIDWKGKVSLDVAELTRG
jgi:hypothetical protein